jgi:predicted HicB family RNase H-like nuclease
VIEYKGYTGVFEYDPSVAAFHGRVLGLRDVVTFEGVSVAELRKEMRASVDDYLEFCAESGREPEKPYRGEFLVRTSPELHRAAAQEAEASGMSLNAWVERAITSVVRERSPEWTEVRPAKSKRRARRSL